MFTQSPNAMCSSWNAGTFRTYGLLGIHVTIRSIEDGSCVADQVHDAGLQRGGRGHRAQRLGRALEGPSVTAIRMSATPRVFRSLKTFTQNFAPSVPSSHSPRMSREPSGRMAQLPAAVPGGRRQPGAPLRWLLLSTGLSAPGRYPRWCDSSAPRARSISALLNARISAPPIPHSSAGSRTDQ
jgi:hypothetical protein